MSGLSVDVRLLGVKRTSLAWPPKVGRHQEREHDQREAHDRSVASGDGVVGAAQRVTCRLELLEAKDTTVIGFCGTSWAAAL